MSIKLEIGLCYYEEHKSPATPNAWLAGCAYIGRGCIAFTEYLTNTVYILHIETSTMVAVIKELVTPRSIFPLPTGGAVIAESTAQRFTVIDQGGTIQKRITLSNIEPWFVAPWEEDWLIVDAHTATVNLVSGKSLNQYQLATPFKLREPRAAVPTSRGTYLLCDSWRHQVVELTLAGQVIWKHGKLDYPSASLDCLNAPEYAITHPNGSVVICDTKNNRVLQVDSHGLVRRVWGGPSKVGSEHGFLWFPVAVAFGPNEEIWVADAANGRLHRLDGIYSEKTLWGIPTVARCLLNSPRSVEYVGTGYLIADSLNNRIVHITKSNEIKLSLDEALGQTFFWPRFATWIAGQLFISDSRNSRILRYSPLGKTFLFQLTLNGKPIPMKDPHSIRLTKENILICDTGQDRVFLVDHHGVIIRIWGTKSTKYSVVEVPVSDMHDSYLTENNELWLADTGNKRLLCITPDGKKLHEIHHLKMTNDIPVAPLLSPRSVQVIPGGHLLVCDSGNHRVLVIDQSGTVFGIYGGRRGLADGYLSHPRFARLNKNRVLIADFGNNRVMDIPLSALTLSHRSP